MAATPRRMWTLYEAVHAVTYFAPEARAAYETAGLRGYWRGYFAGRAAPLGPVGAAPVTALFFGFAPGMVGRAIPDVWSRADPERVLLARRQGAVAALRRLLGDAASSRDAVTAARLLAEAAGAADTSGRALAAANAALPEPDDDPLGRLWQAATTLREHRGDGHVAALVATGLTGREALLLRAALDGGEDLYAPHRGWSDEQRNAARATLVERGWLRPDGTPTDAGREAYAGAEAATDRAAWGPWRALGPERTERLAASLLPLAQAASGALPYPNPIGLPRPDTH